MPDPVASLVKGTLDLLVLRILELQPLHGAAIAERIFQTTRGTFQIKAEPSGPALRSVDPSGENARHCTGWLSPGSRRRTWAVRTSIKNTSAVLSTPDQATVWPSGENASTSRSSSRAEGTW